MPDQRQPGIPQHNRVRGAAGRPAIGGDVVGHILPEEGLAGLDAAVSIALTSIADAAGHAERKQAIVVEGRGRQVREHAAVAVSLDDGYVDGTARRKAKIPGRTSGPGTRRRCCQRHHRLIAVVAQNFKCRFDSAYAGTVSRRWSRTELAARIDHTLLDPAATLHDILMACEIARRNRCATVCLNSNRVAAAREVLQGNGVGIAAVVVFPFGASHVDAKAHEAALAITDGATEIDMVLDIGRLKDGQQEPVRAGIASVIVAAAGRPVKVILECARLTDDEKRTGCALAVEACAALVNTST